MPIALAPLAPLAGKAALTAAKGGLARAALRSFVNGAAWMAGAEIVNQIAEWARSIGGEFDSNDETDRDAVLGCREVAGYGQLEYSRGDGWMAAGQTGAQVSTAQAVKIVSTPIWGPGANGEIYAECEFVTRDFGTVKVQEGDSSAGDASGIIWRINPTVGDCIDFGDGSGGPLGPVPLPPMEQDGCTINATFHGFVGNPDGTGNLLPVYEFSPATEQRAGGGVIVGDCNFAPTIVVGDGGDGKEPPIILPRPDGDDGSDDWWKAIVGGLVGAAANQILDQLAKMVAPQYDAGSFTLTAPCDFTEEGDPVQYFFNFPKGDFYKRVLDHQIAIMDTLQYHLNSKTPTCTPEKPPLEGEWVTTRWVSDEKMDHSGRVLRKQFRYRSKSGLPLHQLSAYWEWFSWKAGPVCVKHTGAWWGNPQVWAASAEEGKRVIRFAAGEAGLDPDQVGKWEVSGSRSPRYGMSGTMRIQHHKGFPWVSSREGADWPNMLAKES